MILDVTRGHIQAEIDGKTVTIQGEAYLPGYGSPAFVMYANSVKHWDPPNETEEIDEPTCQRILARVKAAMAEERGMPVEIE